MSSKPRIAHLAGSNATIANTPPLVTSNKARQKYGLPVIEDQRFDALRPQRLAAPVTVYVEQFSAHPLERDAAELYGPPDGYLDRAGKFHRERASASDVPVYEITLKPEDGLYPLPYMARQADGSAWEDDCAVPNAPAERSRQPFYPDGSRLFDEIDRLGVGEKGRNNLISARADVDFYRVLPPAGDKNIVDAVEYIVSRAWADEEGRNRVGVVLIADQRVFAARDVQKADARPGGFTVTGGHGGLLGAVGHEGPPVLTYIPTRRHTFQSEVNLSRVPREVSGIKGTVQIKNEADEIVGGAIPMVAVVKEANYRD